MKSTGNLDLATATDNQIAASVLLNGLPALWAGLCVGSHPVVGLTVVMTFLLPLLPPAKIEMLGLSSIPFCQKGASCE